MGWCMVDGVRMFSKFGRVGVGLEGQRRIDQCFSGVSNYRNTILPSKSILQGASSRNKGVKAKIV